MLMIIFLQSKTHNYMFLCSCRDFISKRQSKLSKPRRKGLEDQFTGMNIKRKVITKIQRMNVDIFSNQILLE